MANTVIKAEAIHKFFGKKHILQDISLEISQGEIFGILGPSGCEIGRASCRERV